MTPERFEEWTRPQKQSEQNPIEYTASNVRPWTRLSWVKDADIWRAEFWAMRDPASHFFATVYHVSGDEWAASISIRSNERARKVLKSSVGSAEAMPLIRVLFPGYRITCSASGLLYHIVPPQDATEGETPNG